MNCLFITPSNISEAELNEARKQVHILCFITQSCTEICTLTGSLTGEESRLLEITCSQFQTLIYRYSVYSTQPV